MKIVKVITFKKYTSHAMRYCLDFVLCHHLIPYSYARFFPNNIVFTLVRECFHDNAYVYISPIVQSTTRLNRLQLAKIFR
jgi:hypothetical protein